MTGVTQILALGNAKIYQHVGIFWVDPKVWRWGSKPTPGPNANGFASQWNIDLIVQIFMHTDVSPLSPYFHKL